MISFRNIQFLRNVKIPGYEGFGQRLYEALSDSENAHNQAEQQTNSNLSGNPQPPPSIDALNASASDGIFHFSITHTPDFYRDVRYHIEYADNPQFTNPFPLQSSGSPSREHRQSLGGLTLYARASASYGSSAPGPWVYYGGATPKAINGGGPSGPPLPAQSQGSGTGYPGEGLQGPGTRAFRGSTPPTRRTH